MIQLLLFQFFGCRLIFWKEAVAIFWDAIFLLEDWWNKLRSNSAEHRALLDSEKKHMKKKTRRTFVADGTRSGDLEVFCLFEVVI